MEDILYAEERRAFGINPFTLVTYLIGWIYWYIIPDPLKYLVYKLVICPLARPLSSLNTKWVLLMAQVVDACLNGTQGLPRAEVLRRLHGRSNPLQTLGFRLRLLIPPRILTPIVNTLQPVVDRLLDKRRSLEMGEMPDTRPSEAEIADRLKNISRNIR